MGWLFGAGFEYAFTPNWTARLEYDYIGLRDWTFASPVAGDTLNVSRQLNIFTVGLNYKFW
jgi:outer membrane immunogenic protein